MGEGMDKEWQKGQYREAISRQGNQFVLSSGYEDESEEW